MLRFLQVRRKEHVDIRAFELQDRTQASQERTKLEIGSCVKFVDSMLSPYSAEFLLNTFVIESMVFHLQEDGREQNYVDIRLFLTLYDKGNRIRVLQNHEVQCEGTTIGLLEFVKSDDESENFWALLEPDQTHYPLSDFELGQISNRATIQEIGEYLDDYLKDWNV